MEYLNIIDKKRADLIATSDYIWDHAEPAFNEYRSSECLRNVLTQEGFIINTGLAGMPTAFSARFGAGKPVIGFLGEFDALENLGQVAGVTEKCEDGQKYGHGCGHNLLGTATLGAAIVAKEYLCSSKHSGTVVYYGCPAEEDGSGKTFMARAGIFDELDAALCWHPDEKTGIRAKTSLANVKILYSFKGKAAHASKHPFLGRSALDAVELMNIGVNYLREHIIPEARIHYAIIDTGGSCPNIVQDHASVLYLIRAPRSEQVQDLLGRVNSIAEGSALMTQTETTSKMVKACSNYLQNCTLEKAVYDIMKHTPLPKIDSEEMAFAKEMSIKGLNGYPNANPDKPIFEGLEPYNGQVELAYGSTDVGDVSWICPTVQIMAATHVLGTPNHSWQQTAQGKQPLAHEMMLYVSKVLGAAAVKLFTSPDILEKAKIEHKASIGENGYHCPIPNDINPMMPVTSN